MSITLDLPPDLQEQLYAEALRRNQRVEDVVLSAIAESLSVGNDVKPENSDQWHKDFKAWIASHRPVSHFVDDSRESIY
jgi:ABC-type molybdenum transport system ATPase subunit/photorepair protein PhrA